ncbi:MAG: ABC transporter permease, partial [Acidobacteriota bacterium]
ALQAAAGSTDFSGLFVGFSFFLILSAALLVGLLFRLGAEQRGREVGVLLSLGFPAAKVRRRFLLEGGLVALLGGLLGLAGAVGYAWLMMAGLRTWWVAAVGTPFLQLHVQQQSLVIGFAASLLVVLLSILLAVRKLSKLPPPALLAGVTSLDQEKGPSRASRWTARLSLLLAFLLLAASFFVEAGLAAGIFFGVGACLLVAGLALFAIWCRRTGQGQVLGAMGDESIHFPMAVRNASRNPGRSLLSVALVSSACFVIVAVGAFQQHIGDEVLQKDSGAGGFPLLAQSDVPIHRNLNSPEVRAELGLDGLSSVQRLYPFRLLPGEDASCLNLYKPEKPRLLGVPEELIERGGFRFSSALEERDNPWTLLQDDLGPGVIPAFADANSAQWILKVPLGGDLELVNEAGETVQLRLAGLLQTSIFQSELLISEQRFVENFPSRGGYSYFLIESPEGAPPISAILESALSAYGLDITSTAAKLAGFYAVQNTYLSTFQTLGGLGLLLGTLGLGVILTRNVNERRSELATLRAFGFSRKMLARIVLTENVFLLSLGILLGAVAALLAVFPHILSQASSIPWLSLAATLLLIFAVGLLSSAAAVRTALRTPLLPALKEER